ncbi:prolyl oligopeptidase family serine peptidase [Pacificimonas flava]|uniref:Oligopeptidase B n=1 Tax=Pacificimonas flava TaxID=1234595 RepID=M2U9H8_9SPHN|nr:prolyl oligopeptidase family serine peptidase [Pacificimonas flava]EMD84617.1 Oligopeptidase B [Pacificimonas flava]MBB5279514.1 oligopeptidase B [Pacificimonas flava]
MPRAQKIPKRIEQLGRTRTDPYAWLKDEGPGSERTLETLASPIAEQLRAEMAYAKRILAPGADLEETLFSEMQARSAGDMAAPPMPAGDLLSGTPQGLGRPVYRLESGTGSEVVLDENARAEDRPYYRTTGHQRGGSRWFVWAEDIVGADEFRIVARDLDSGAVRTVVPGGVFGYGGIAATGDAVYWLRRNDRARPDALMRTPLLGGEAKLLYEEDDPAFFLGLKKTAAGGLIVLSAYSPDRTEIWTVDAKTPQAEPQRVVSRSDGERAELFEWQDAPLLLTDRGGAFDQKIVPLRGTLASEPLLPHRPGVPIEMVMPFASALVWLERQDALPVLRILRPSMREAMTMRFDGPAYNLSVPEDQPFDAETIRVRFETPATPPIWYDVNLRDGSRTLVKRATLPGVDPGAYQVERIDIPSTDGASVPVTILRRRGARSGRMEGRAPLLLTGYGAYGLSSEAEFSLPALSLVDRGWTYAIAHVRGGGERGRRWFEDGRRFRKHHSFDDFNAAAHALAASHGADPQRMVAFGLSAGGLLLGGALNQEPGLFAGAIMKVPFVDMLNTMSDADHPLVPLFRPDWGDPLADPEAYDYMASISPYENVKRAPYPPILTTAGLKDDRVAYWEPAKFIAAVRDRSTSGKPAILYLDPEAGHQPDAGSASALREAARFWTFAIRAAAHQF